MREIIMKLLEFLLSLFDKPEIKKELTRSLPESNLSIVNNLIQEPVSQPTNNKSEFKIIRNFLPFNQYVHDSEFVPEMIFLHHTAGASINSSIDYWKNSKDRVGVHFCIDRNGETYQCIPLERAWAYHLYVASPGNKIDRRFKKLSSLYDKKSIGIELAGFGYVDLFNNKFINCYGQVVDSKKVIKLDKPYKGKLYWENYTDEQIESLKNLLLYLLDSFPKIAKGLKSNYEDIFTINEDALNLKPGIYSHTSVRTDKWDLYPNPNLITMLNELHKQI